MFQLIAKILATFFLQNGSTEFYYLIPGILYLFGMYGLFRKSGIKGWQALIPCLHEVRLGEAVGMEKEGRVTAMLRGLIIISGEASVILS